MAKKLKHAFLDNLKYMSVIIVFIFISNLIVIKKGQLDINIFDCIPILIVFLIASLVSVLIRTVIKLEVPAVVYAALLMTIISLPVFPWFDTLQAWVGGVTFNAFLTPIIAFTGICLGKDLAQFVRTGPKLIVISILVFIGTYLGSATIAQISLMITGVI